MELKKISKEIENDFKKVMDDEYNEEKWKKDGRKINLKIKKFDNIKGVLKSKLDDEKLKNNSNDTLQTIENYLENLENDIVPLIMKINEKTKFYTLQTEEESNENQNEEDPQANMLIQDLKNNQEILQERRNQLETIHQTSAKIKDISDEMVKQLENQGAILDDIEANVNTAEDNAKKAKQEIIKADENSRGNRKKMICLIVIIFLTIAAICAILFSLIL